MLQLELKALAIPVCRVHLVFPCVYLAVTLLILVLPAIVKPVETGVGVAIILTALPVYFGLIKW